MRALRSRHPCADARGRPGHGLHHLYQRRKEQPIKEFTIYRDIEYNLIIRADTAAEAVEEATRIPYSEWNESLYDDSLAVYEDDKRIDNSEWDESGRYT